MPEQTDAIDAAFQKLKTLLAEAEQFGDTLFTESDTRIKIIDTMLLDILGWQKAEVFTEQQAGKGYLDYKLTIEDLAKLIVEAKRDARAFDLSARDCGGTYKLSGPVFNNDTVQEGIDQAVHYSAYKGAELACVTNGREWVVFRSNRIGDGMDILDGKAFVFPSLQCVHDQFRLFYDLLAKPRVKSLVFRGLFQEAEGRIIRHADFEKRLRLPATAQFLAQPEIVPALDRIMTSFFQRLTDEHDQEMLEECFVETKESKAAEQRLLRLAEDLVGHIRPLDTRSGEQLSTILEHAKKTKLNQFILIVGTKGAGKSTFIQRFFNLMLPATLREACVPISVNLSDSDGDERRIVEWLRLTLLQKAEHALGGGIPSWDEIIGHMFFSEYQRWSTGSMKHLYEKDKQEFKIQFGQHIEKIRADNPLEYIRGLLRNLVLGRKQLPCLVFDNADHFSIDFQERVFQFARSLFEQELCVVIMPITDKTSWQLSRQGALQSFENEALLLPTPSARQVVEKRIAFVLKKLKEQQPKEKETYFFGKGIRVDFTDLLKFITALEEIFLNSDKTAYWIGCLANHDVRQVLLVSRDLINSPHLGFDEAFKAYVTSSVMHIPDWRIRKAMVRGRYDIYPADSHKYVHNVFDLNAEVRTSPLLGLRILQVARDAAIRHGETRTDYIAKSDLLAYMCGMGFERRVVALWLDALLKRALLFNYDPTCVDEQHATQLEISPTGELHLFWGCGGYEYLYAMAETTPVRDEAAFTEMQLAYRDRFRDPFYGVMPAFLRYLVTEDQIYCRTPDHESYTGQVKLLAKIEAAARRLETAG
jgi:energy-coupling factor transporter ATP-binding protein EcfA2